MILLENLVVVTCIFRQAFDANCVSLCFSPNAFSNWCASIALSHCLKDNAIQKEQLLRVQLATSVGKSGFDKPQIETNLLSPFTYQ